MLLYQFLSAVFNAVDISNALLSVVEEKVVMRRILLWGSLSGKESIMLFWTVKKEEYNLHKMPSEETRERAAKIIVNTYNPN